MSKVLFFKQQELNEVTETREEESEVPQIEWPERKIDADEYNNAFEDDDDFNRPDSGVGESVS